MFPRVMATFTPSSYFYIGLKCPKHAMKSQAFEEWGLNQPGEQNLISLLQLLLSSLISGTCPPWSLLEIPGRFFTPPCPLSPLSLLCWLFTLWEPREPSTEIKEACLWPLPAWSTSLLLAQGQAGGLTLPFWLPVPVLLRTRFATPA